MHFDDAQTQQFRLSRATGMHRILTIVLLDRATILAIMKGLSRALHKTVEKE
jgi:hypothetical protein